MKKTILAAVLATLGVIAGACNSVGDCPGASSITPGGSCSGDNLQCPYTTPATVCNGTTVDDGGAATSCTCVEGKWSCPSAASCEGGGGGGDDSGSDAAAEASGDSTVDVVSDTSPTEASSEAAIEASHDAATEASLDAPTEGASEAATDATGN